MLFELVEGGATNIATAVVIYPIVRRQSEGVALGYVTARIVESAFILVGLMSIISTASVSAAFAGATGAEATALAVQGNSLSLSLAATYDWAFLFGPGLVVGFGNGLMLGYLMYRSGLVPRRMAMLGLIGGPMLIVSFGFILFGVYENGSGPAFLMALPEIAWEASLGVYAAWKGFRAEPDHQDDGPPRIRCRAQYANGIAPSALYSEMDQHPSSGTSATARLHSPTGRLGSTARYRASFSGRPPPGRRADQVADRIDLIPRSEGALGADGGCVDVRHLAAMGPPVDAPATDARSVQHAVQYWSRTRLSTPTWMASKCCSVS